MTTPALPAPTVPLSRAGLARRYGVARSIVTRTLQQAAKAHAQDPTRTPPPQPLNPGEPIELFDPHVFDGFWYARPGRGRPRTSDRHSDPNTTGAA
ncbi:hypothetical protein [Embleya sp. NPDC005971]|uniref:hypothetical protein n=1 Tax=Embleya sp. NPDC005971 TaxID=3156724 RepID=UPI00340787AD